MIEIYPRQAYAYLNAHKDALMIDVRSEIEFMLIGHAESAIHIPWYLDIGRTINPDFLDELSRIVGGRDRPLIFICRTGSRSKEAGLFVEQNGFAQIFNVLHGFEGDRDESNRRSVMNGWRYEGLPWEQC